MSPLATTASRCTRSCELAARLQARQIQQIGDDPGEPHGLPLELLGEPRHRRRVLLPHVQERLRRRLDRRRRRLQLVGSVGDEVATDGVQAPRLGDIGDHGQDRAVAARGCGRDPEPARRRTGLDLGDLDALGFGDAPDGLAEARRDRPGRAPPGAPRDDRSSASVREHRSPSAVEQQHAVLHRAQDLIADLSSPPPRPARARSRASSAESLGVASSRTSRRSVRRPTHTPTSSPTTTCAGDPPPRPSVECRPRPRPFISVDTDGSPSLHPTARRPARPRRCFRDTAHASPAVHLTFIFGQPGVHHASLASPRRLHRSRNEPTTRRTQHAQREEAGRASWQGCSPFR